ncbi:Unknown protein sequence [Pseudomonas syringae pv. syringae]|nr:Unknown protein sequence [Pseudomonas syringae pv. syringae]
MPEQRPEPSEFHAPLAVIAAPNRIKPVQRVESIHPDVL